MAEYVRVDNLEVSDYVTVWDCDCSEFGRQTVMAVDDLQYLPTADVVEVVRCKDCNHAISYSCKNDACYKAIMCEYKIATVDENFYCGCAEPRTPKERGGEK